MKILNFGFKIFSLLSVVFPLSVYIFYAVIKAGGFQSADINIFRNISGNLMAISFYGVLGGIILMLVFYIKKYRFSKAYIWLLLIGIFSWILVFYVDPGGIFLWFFD